MSRCNVVSHDVRGVQEIPRGALRERVPVAVRRLAVTLVSLVCIEKPFKATGAQAEPENRDP